jgi:hypothetical protein
MVEAFAIWAMFLLTPTGERRIERPTFHSAEECWDYVRELDPPRPILCENVVGLDRFHFILPDK